MDPVNPLAALACLFAALATSFLLLKRFGFPRQSARFASIDGLRGYLAFFVFLHHACIWYFYLQTGEWGRPPSNLYSHLGRSSVVLFFMITGFLFFTKFHKNFSVFSQIFYHCKCERIIAEKQKIKQE